LADAGCLSGVLSNVWLTQRRGQEAAVCPASARELRELAAESYQVPEPELLVRAAGEYWV
jgi:hypothetical protein